MGERDWDLGCDSSLSFFFSLQARLYFYLEFEKIFVHSVYRKKVPNFFKSNAMKETGFSTNGHKPKKLNFIRK
jgi:hypothetical protein